MLSDINIRFLAISSNCTCQMFTFITSSAGVSHADNECGYQDSVDRQVINGVCYACPKGCTATNVDPETSKCTCSGCDAQCYVDDDDDDGDDWDDDDNDRDDDDNDRDDDNDGDD